MRAHLYRTLGVGVFSGWVVAADRWTSGQEMDAGRFALVAACAAAAWFLVGSGSGVLWSFLPTFTRHGPGPSR